MASNNFSIFLLFYFFIIYGLADTIDNPSDYGSLAAQNGWLTSTACKTMWMTCYGKRPDEVCYKMMNESCKAKPTTKITTMSQIPETTIVTGTVIETTTISDIGDLTSNSQAGFSSSPTSSVNPLSSSSMSATAPIFSTNSLSTSKLIEKNTPTSMTGSNENVESKSDYISSTLDQADLSSESSIRPLQSSSSFPFSKQNIQSSTEANSPITTSSSGEELSSTVSTLSSEDSKQSGSSSNLASVKTSVAFEKFTTGEQSQMSSISNEYFPSATMEYEVSSKKSFVESTTGKLSTSPAKGMTTSFDQTKATTVNNKLSSIGKSIESGSITTMESKIIDPIMDLTSQAESITTPLMTVNNLHSSTDFKSSSSSKLISTSLLDTTMPFDKMPLSSNTQIIATTPKETQDKVSSSISSSLSPSQFPTSSSLPSSKLSTPVQSSTSSNEISTLSAAANSLNLKTSHDFKSSDSISSSQSSSISSTEDSKFLTSSPEIKTTGIKILRSTKTKMPSVSSSSISVTPTPVPLITDDKLINSMSSLTTLKEIPNSKKYSSTERLKLFSSSLPQSQEATTESEINSISTTPQNTNLQSETTNALKASIHPLEFQNTATTFEIPLKSSDSTTTPFLTGTTTSESIIKTSIDPSIIKSSSGFTPSLTSQKSSSNSVTFVNSHTTLTVTESTQGSRNLITTPNNNNPISETTISNSDGDKSSTLTQPSSPSLINNNFATSTVTNYPSQSNSFSSLELKSSDATKNYESPLQSSSRISTANINPTVGPTFTSTEGEMDDVTSSKIYTEFTKPVVENHESSSALQTTTKIINPTSAVSGDVSTKSRINYDFPSQSSNYFKYPTTKTTNNLVVTSTSSQTLQEQEMSSTSAISSPQSRRSTDVTTTKSMENEMTTTNSKLAVTTLKNEANIDHTFKTTTSHAPAVFDTTNTYSMDDKERTSIKLHDIEVTIKDIDTTLQTKVIIPSHPTRGSTVEKNIKANTEELNTPSPTTNSGDTSVSNNFNLPFEKVSTKTDELLMSTKKIENKIPLTKTSALESTEASTCIAAEKMTTSKFIDLTLLPQKQTDTSDSGEAIQLTSEVSSHKTTSVNLVESETSRIPFLTKESSLIKPTTTISPTSDSSKIQMTSGFPIAQQSSFKTITDSETPKVGSTEPISRTKFSSANSFINSYTSPTSDSKIIYSSSPKASTEVIIDATTSSMKTNTIKAINEVEDITTQSSFKYSVTTLSGNNNYDSSSMKIETVKETQIANFPTSKSGSTLDQSSKPSREFTTTMMEGETTTKLGEERIVVTIAASMTTTDISDFETIITEQQQVSDQLNTKTSKDEMQTHSQNSFKFITNQLNTLSLIVGNEATTQTPGSESSSIKTAAMPLEHTILSSTMDEGSTSQSHTTKQGKNKLSTQAASKYATSVVVTNEEATDSNKFVTIETSKYAQASEPHAITNQAVIDQSLSTLKSKFEMPSTERSIISKVSSEASTMATPKVIETNDAKLNTAASLTDDQSSKVYSSKAEYSTENAKTSQVSNIGTTTMPETSPFEILSEITSSKTPFAITTLPDKPESKSTAAMTKNKLTETPFFDNGKTTETNTYSSSSSPLSSAAKFTNSELASLSTATLPSSISSSTSLPATTNSSCDTTVTCPKGFVEGFQSCFRLIESSSSKGMSYKGLEKLCMAFRDDAVIASMVDYEMEENIKLFKQLRANSKLNKKYVFTNALDKDFALVIEIDKLNYGNKTHIFEYSILKKSPQFSAICRVGKNCNKYACDLNQYMSSPSAELFAVNKGTKSLAMPNETITVYCNFEKPDKNFEIKCDRKGYFLPDASTIKNCTNDEELPETQPTAASENISPPMITAKMSTAMPNQDNSQMTTPNTLEPENIKFDINSCNECSSENTVSCSQNKNGIIACNCDELHSGKTCNLAIDFCRNLTCLNSGKAVSKYLTSCSCVCTSEYFGDRCEIDFYNGSYAEVYNRPEQGMTVTQFIAAMMNMGFTFGSGLERMDIPIEACRNLITVMVAFANFCKIFCAVPFSPNHEDMDYCNMFFWGSATFFIYSLTLMCAESMISLNIITGRWNNLFHRQCENRENKTISLIKFHFWIFIFAFIPIIILWNSSSTLISFKSCMGTMNYFVNDSNELNIGAVMYSFIIGLYTLFACTLGLIARMKINVPQYEIRKRQQIMASGPYAYGKQIYPVEFSVRYCLPVLRPLFLSAAWMSAIYSRETLTFYASAIATGISGIHGFVNFIQSQTTTAQCMDSTIETGITLPSWMPRFISRLWPRYNTVTLQTRDEILRICDPKQWKEEKEERAAQQHPDTPRIRYPIPFEEHIERDGPLPYRVITMGFRFGIFRYEMDPYAYDLSLLKRTIPMELLKLFKTNWTLIYLENRANGLLRYESMAQVLMEIKKSHLAAIYIPHSRIVALFKNFMANMTHIDQLQIRNPGSRHEINVEAQKVFHRGIEMLKLQMAKHIDVLKCSGNGNSEWISSQYCKADPLLTEDKQQKIYDMLDSICNGITQEDIFNEKFGAQNNNDNFPGAAYIVANDNNRDIEANIGAAPVVREVAPQNRINNSMFNVAYNHDFQNNVFDPLIEETLEPAQENNVADAQIKPFSLHQFLLNERRPNFVGPRSYGNQIPPGINLLQYTAFYWQEINDAVWNNLEDLANLELIKTNENLLRQFEKYVT